MSQQNATPMRISDAKTLIPDRAQLARRLQHLVLPALNHLLAADPQAQGKLSGHAGKTLVFSALGVDLPWEIDASGLLQTASQTTLTPGEANLHITVDPAAVQDAIVRRAPLNLSGARLRGDAELAQTLSWLMAHVRWDVEDDLAQIMGDIPAHRLVQTGQAAVSHGQQAWARAHERARDWFAAEPRALISRGEWAQQQEAVRELRDRAARLEKRLALLRQQCGIREN